MNCSAIVLVLFYILTQCGHLTATVFALQRIRELEDRIDLQKRQIKEIEEKVHIHILLVSF